MFGGLMTKQQHNINCINQILGLNIPQITAAVRNAIRKHNIFDGDRPTNADLLYIVFDCLTSYLENLNLQHIRSNEQILIKQIDQIGQILEIVNVGKYLQYVDYRFRISNVISKKVSNNMVSLTLSGVYLQAENAFKNQEKHSYSKMLDLITSVTLVANETPENALTAKQLKFWFENVIPMIFDKNRETQTSAMKAVEAALPFIRMSPYQEHTNWPALEKNITNEYSDVVIMLRENGNSLWYRMWNLLVKLLNKKLLKGASVINKFLAICEHGFKSPNYTTRAETFLCWKVLLEIYSQDAKYLSAKRIKLLLIPFKPLAKSPQIAVNKFLVWWSLICKVENQIDQYYDTILVPFLWFCFGLTDKPILSKAVDIGHRQEVYPELTALSTTALINLLGPINDVTSTICKSSPIERIREPLVMPGLLEHVGRFLINSCGEATFLLKDVKLVDAIPISENLWSNMMDRMKENSDPTLTELILQNLNILTNASQNDEPAIKIVTHVASIVLSSKNLIPMNTSDEITFGILKRIAQLLTTNIIHLNDIALKKVIDNVFTFSTETKRLHLQFQQILTLLQSQKVLSNVRVGIILWYKVAIYIIDSLAVNIDKHKEVIYGYVEWAVKNAKIDQLPVFLTTWKNLARFLLNNDRDGVFWHRMYGILRVLTDDTDTKSYKFVASVFELIKPSDPFPSKLKSLIETIAQSTPSSLATELEPIIDEINKFSEQITGEHANETYQSLNELVNTVEAKFDISLRNQFSVFNKFRNNFENYSKSQNLMVKPSKAKNDEFVFIPSKWQFRPDNLTEHQKEKLKEKRVDIPALYNDMSQSQDSHSISLKPWTPKEQFKVNPAERPDQECNDGIDEKKSSDDALDRATPMIQPSQSQTNTMASTSLDNCIVESTNINLNEPTASEVNELASSKVDEVAPSKVIEQVPSQVGEEAPSKVDEEERKRKRVQNELNKLQLSITNADQYSLQGRTRRMSCNITKPEQRLRNRGQTTSDKVTSIKRKKRATTTSADNFENDSSEIIEASQTLPLTPTTNQRRTRQSRGSLSATQVSKEEKSVSDGEKSLEKVDKNESNQKENVSLNVSVDSRSIGQQTVQKTQEITTKLPEAATELPENVEEKFRATQKKDSENDDTEMMTVNVSKDEKKSNAENLIEISDDEVIPEETRTHSLFEGPHSEAIVTETISSSPVKEHSGEDSPTSKASFIITSPSTNKDCSKTKELLNSTVDISPILHAKSTKKTDGTTESETHQRGSNTEMECCIENIEKDQIKRSELDNLIKTPMDSPMLQIQKSYNLPCNSTPQSHKDTKRKFQLQGRGAQLLQLMNIRKVEEASLFKARSPVRVSEPTTSTAETMPPAANNSLSYEDILATNKDLFRFSKVLPSPQASPSNSIMKRNINEVTDADDIDSPGQKRKRVSFHDPPVSATKEFLRFAEEVNPNRLRINRHSGSPLNARNILTRKCRADSLNEINKLTLPLDDTTANKSENSMKSLKFNATDDDEEVGALPSLTFSNKDEALQYVFDEYPMEDVLGKYFESGLSLNDSSTKIFANQLTNTMKNDESKRKLILEDMSEQFPKEFLDVAFQENLTSTVIERLPPTTILNYITEQAKADNNAKVQLIEKFSTVVAESASSSAQSEMNDELYKLLLQIISHKMSDKQLLDVLDVIFEKRRTNSSS